MRAALAVLLSLTAGCSSLTHYEPKTYTVRSGDTLYSIAWRHGLDHRELARWNNLADPGRIFVGQRLVLSPQSASAPVARAPVARAPVARDSSARAPAASTGRGTAPAFSWPAEGSVVARFGEGRVLATGIGIAGRAGQDIRAAAPGRVVYAGRGLPDYGQLVIIEHNESWLTAYGYNRILSVAQGDTVTRGQKIGEMGEGPGREPRLYFEIRRNGDPLDPLGLLPASD
jgi:lipoprotein NlpD